MRVSDVLTRVRQELTEPIPSEWSNAELVSYLNAGFQTMWRRASEVGAPFLFSRLTLTCPANVNEVSLLGEETVPPGNNAVSIQRALSLTMGLSEGERRLLYIRPERFPFSAAMAGDPDRWTLVNSIEYPSILVFPTPREERTLCFTYIPSPPKLRYDTTTLADDEIPLPSQFCDLLVSWTVARAYNRLGGKPDLELSIMSSHANEFERLLELYVPSLLAGRGPW